MPFIEMMNEKTEFYNRLWSDTQLKCLTFLGMLVCVCAYILLCDDFYCAILVVQVLVILYCLLWTFVTWKMLTMVELTQELRRKLIMEAKKDAKLAIMETMETTMETITDQ
jgi:hypothetical protein